jgi:glucose-6-phosphate-specific signal transduction histidine kinase
MRLVTPRGRVRSWGWSCLNGHVSLLVETTGSVVPVPPMEGERRRYGLIGMRERVSALGGEFAAGPTSGAWRVSCRFPLEVADDTPGAGP